MSRKAAPLFHEEQALRQKRTRILLAVPPTILLLLVIWQVLLGHSWGKQPMSNASLVGWAIFLWLVYLRLITVRLVTDVRPRELSVAMRGLWRRRRIPLDAIQSLEVITFDPVRDYGGYGIRATRRETAYIAGGNQGVRLQLAKGTPLVVGSGKPEQLAQAIRHASAGA